MKLYRISYKQSENDHWVFCDAISSKERVLSSANLFHDENPSYEVIAEEEDWNELSPDKYDNYMMNAEHEGFGIEFEKNTGLKSKSTHKILTLLPKKEDSSLDEKSDELYDDIFGEPKTSAGRWLRKEWIYILGGFLIWFFFLR
ncbi:hypothetical protein N9N74_05495 [Gammaproteobacteria bacterium]|nr:hypothetical protein [Gammaproteobacteria bacterium]